MVPTISLVGTIIGVRSLGGNMTLPEAYGSFRVGQRAAAIMSLVQSAKFNGHDPFAYLKDVLTRLPTQKANRIEELLPHYWQSPDGTNA
jgi:transposase